MRNTQVKWWLNKCCDRIFGLIHCTSPFLWITEQSWNQRMPCQHWIPQTWAHDWGEFNQGEHFVSTVLQDMSRGPRRPECKLMSWQNQGPAGRALTPHVTKGRKQKSIMWLYVLMYEGCAKITILQRDSIQCQYYYYYLKVVMFFVGLSIFQYSFYTLLFNLLHFAVLLAVFIFFWLFCSDMYKLRSALNV